jgi:hypothetical protein
MIPEDSTTAIIAKEDEPKQETALKDGPYKVYVKKPPRPAPQFVPDSVVLMNDRLMQPPVSMYRNRLTFPSAPNYFTAIPR